MAFAPFGDVIEVSDHAETRDTNERNTHRYHNLAQLNLGANGGEQDSSASSALIFQSVAIVAGRL